MTMEALFWAVVVLGAAPFHDMFALSATRRGNVFVARSPRVKVIRLLEIATVGLFFLVVVVWGRDFPLTASPGPARYAGFVLAAAGAALAGWSKIHLRRNFSLNLGVKEDHRLLTDGPYGRVRHPMYTGLLLEMTGAALFFNSGGTLVGMALPFGGFFYWQSAEEEKLLEGHFGEAYRRYRARTGRLLPRLSGGSMHG